MRGFRSASPPLATDILYHKVRRRGSRTRLCLTFASGHVTPLPCVGPSGALGWVGHGLSTASPRRPTEAACILYAFFGKAKQCPERGAGALLRTPESHSFLVPLRRNAGSSRQARQIGPPFENRIRVLFASRLWTARRRTRMRVPLRRHTQSRSLSCCGIRLPDRSNAPVVGRHWTAGQERLFAATIGTTGFHRTGRRVKQTNNGDLDCWTSCPLSGENERTAHPGGASEGAGLSPDVSFPLIGRPMGRTRVPPGFHPRRFPCPAVAGVGRRARRAWKLKVALPGGLGPPACGLGNRRSVLVSYGSLGPRKTPGLA